MATQYPAKIDDIITLPVLVDGVHAINATVINRLREAIIAIEEELGESPASVYTNVKERLDNLDITFGNLQVVALTGDLGGSYATPKVIGINGTPVSTASPTVNQGLVFNGTSWAPANLAAGSLAFTASGDLSGTELAQTVIGLQGRSIAADAPNDGDILTWETATTSWKPLPAPVGFSAGGDLTGTATNQTVVAIQGYTISTDVPTDGYSLTWDTGTSTWRPELVTATSVQMGRNYGNYLDILAFSINAATSLTVFQNAAAFTFNPSLLTSANGTRTMKMRYVVETTAPQITVQLYNITTSTVVASSVMTSTSTTPVVLTTPDLTAELPSGTNIYKVQIKMAAGGVADQVLLNYAALRIEWS